MRRVSTAPTATAGSSGLNWNQIDPIAAFGGGRRGIRRNAGSGVTAGRAVSWPGKDAPPGAAR